MQHHLITIGKFKRSPEHALYEHYAGRLRGGIRLHELAGFPKLDSQQRRIKETQQLFHAAKEAGAQHVICLDETGRAITSTDLAAKLQCWQDEGTRSIAWLIGGDVGFDKSQLRSSTMCINLGSMTWPHLLVRALVTEQLYRAECILSGHPYHRV